MKNSLVCHMEKSKSWQDKLINFKWASGVLRVEIRVDDAVFPPHVCLKVSLLWQPSLWQICKLCKEKKNRIWLILHFRLLQMNNRRCDNFSQMSSARSGNKFSTPLLISRRQIFRRYRAEPEGSLWRKWQIGEYHSHETVFVLWLSVLKIRHEKEERKKLVSISELETRRFSRKIKFINIRRHLSWITMPT